MLEYLHANNFTTTFNALQSDARTTYSPDPKAKYVGLLEKKWMSVIRLQKKVRAVVLESERVQSRPFLDHGLGEPKRCPSRRVIAISRETFCITGRLAPKSTSRTRTHGTSIHHHACGFPPTIFYLGLCKRRHNRQDMGLGNWRVRANAQRAYESYSRCRL
jgi:hypothetical protein